MDKDFAKKLIELYGEWLAEQIFDSGGSFSDFMDWLIRKTR